MPVRQRHPGFVTSVLADARATAAYRGERHEFGSRRDALAQIARLVLVSDAFGAQIAYRLKAALQRRRVPLLPRLAHRIAIAGAAIYIGDEVLVQPGLYVVHGQVVIDGPVEIGREVAISPAVTVSAPREGPPMRIGRAASLGTGSRLLGSLTVGARAQIGAGAVIVDDVPDGGTAVGIAAGLPRRSA